MAGPARSILALAAFALVTHAHIPSHDNILRVQLWDAEGLSREPLATQMPATTTPKVWKHHSTKVSAQSLYDAMIEEYGAEFGRFTRHRVRHKRRRSRRSEHEGPWRFHDGSQVRNVEVFDAEVPWEVIDEVVDSEVSDASDRNETRSVSPPKALRQDEEEEEVKKQLPIVPKCCASGQNLSVSFDENGQVKSSCSRSSLTFQPVFHKANDTHIWSFDTNVFETIVGNPCKHDRYRLDPYRDSTEEFYLLVNGSLFVPYNEPNMLGTRDFCMETFWNESFPAGLTLPLVCFVAQEEVKTSAAFILYATGLLISVPFLLATACVYLFITELRDTHGKSLACHCIFLAIAFSSLAATQLAGHAFPGPLCTVIAYVIQFSFVSCFFWLNVMSFDIFLNVRRYINSTLSRRSMRRRFAWYCSYAVTLPLILLVVTITMDLHPAVPSTYLKPSFGVKACWFETDQAALPYFYGPVALILISNLIIFFFTSRAFAVHYDKLKDLTPLDMAHSDYSTTDDWVRLGTVLGQPIPVHERTTSPSREEPVNFNERLKKYRKIFRTCCLLSFIMGLSWVLEVVSWAAGAGTEAVSVWSVFDLINALQGVVIFAIFVLQQPIRSYVKFSKLFKTCRRKSDGLEVAVVSERDSIDCGNLNSRRAYV